MKKTSLLIVLASRTLVAGIALSQVWAQGVDSPPLVGKWEGTWVNISHPNARGDYNMTITKVEGNKVHGRIEKQGFPSGSTTYDIVGILEGHKLMYGTASTSTELMVNGKQLRGTSADGFRLAIEMTKVKEREGHCPALAVTDWWAESESGRLCQEAGGHPGADKPAERASVAYRLGCAD